jgi:hypothetical protein
VSWDGFQREVLAELGLRAYTLAGHEAPATRATAAVDAAQAAAPGALPPALVAALARAAGCAPAQVLVLAGIDAAPRDAAARRALWPRLRRLRVRAR